MNRGTEHLKIQVYVGYCHSEFRSRVSYFFGAIVSLYVTLMGLLLQGTLKPDVYYATLLLSAPIFGVSLWLTYRGYQKSLGKVDNMIGRVDEGNPLPSVKYMIKGKAKVNETSAEKNPKKFDLFGQAFFLMYGLIMGLLAGVWGNLWATLFFEHVIKGDESLIFHFLVASIILTCMIVVLVVYMIRFHKKMEKIAKRKDDSPTSLSVKAMINYAKLNKNELIEMLCTKYEHKKEEFKGHSKEYILSILRKHEAKKHF